MAALLKISSQFSEVVNFTVEHDGQLAARKVHRLMPQWRQVQDCESAMGQAHAPIIRPPLTRVVWAPVDQGIAGNRKPRSL